MKGVDTNDVSLCEMFKMWAALMWTISDFPGRGTLFGWNTHIRLAYVMYNFDATPLCLPHSKRNWCF